MQQNKDLPEAHVPGAHVILYLYGEDRLENDTRILLHKRDTKAKSYAGYWALFGGQMEEKDRDPKRTVIREVQQELKEPVKGTTKQKQRAARRGVLLKLKSLKRVCCVQVIRGKERLPIHFFKAKLAKNASRLSLGKEGDGLGLFSRKEIDQLPMRPEERLAIERFFSGSDFGYMDHCDTCHATNNQKSGS